MLIEELRHAARSLIARPGPTLVVVLCLSLGIGANIGLFGVVDALLFRPPVGVSDAGAVVRVRPGVASSPLASATGPVSTYPAYARVRDQRTGRLFSAVAAYGGGASTVGAGADAQPVSSQLVTSSYFDVMGVRPVLGRFFTPAEGVERAGVPVAVLSHSYWRRAFGSDPRVLGRTLRIGATVVTIVGVSPAGFVGADLAERDLWLPVGMAGQPGFGAGYGAGCGCWQIVARLRPGLSLDAARAELAAESTGRASLTVIPFSEADAAHPDLPMALTLEPVRPMFGATEGEAPVPFWALGVSGALLLLACATVANLLLARAIRRRRDVAIRLSLGASPRRVLVGGLLESGVLALASALGAAAVAALAVTLAEKLPVPPLGPVLNARTVAFGLLVALGTPLLFGLVPAFWAARRNVGEVLKQGGNAAAPTGTLRALMGLQVGIAFSLLLLGGLFLRSLQNVRNLPLGWDADRVIAVYMELPAAVAVPEWPELRDRAADDVQRVPGVEAAAPAGVVPFYTTTHTSVRIEDGRPDEAQPEGELTNAVGPGYFRVLGIPILSGRAFERADRRPSAPVAIVSAAFARQNWAGRSPLGSCITFGSKLFSDALNGACAHIVGVAGDAKYDDLVGPGSPVVYLPASQLTTFPAATTLLVRAAGDPRALVEPVRHAVQAADPRMPFPRIEPMSALLQRRMFRWDVAARLLTVIGALALLLGAIGLYGLVSFLAEQRRRELGVRAVLGAGRERLVGLVLTDGLRVSALGLVLGAAAALGFARLLASRLYGITYASPSTYLAVALGLVLVALLASLRPALLASRSDPAAVLRED